jgi:hypothetical protein
VDPLRATRGATTTPHPPAPRPTATPSGAPVLRSPEVTPRRGVGGCSSPTGRLDPLRSQHPVSAPGTAPPRLAVPSAPMRTVLRGRTNTARERMRQERRRSL